jgi:hypothetical protein
MGAEERGPEDFAGVDLERGAGTVPEAIEIVDLYHARQHLWDLGSKLYPCENAAKRRRAMSHQYWLDAGKIELLVLTVACCFNGSICSSGVPAVTRSPDFTKIFVICPSTWGLIVAECRDFKMDKYSVVSGIFCDFAICTCTGIACTAPPAASPADVFPHPARKVAKANSPAAAADLLKFPGLTHPGRYIPKHISLEPILKRCYAKSPPTPSRRNQPRPLETP